MPAKTGMGDGAVQAALMAGLSALSFALAGLFNFDVGMGAGLALHLMDITLHPIARYAKTPAVAALCFVLPIAAAQALFGDRTMLVCIVVVRLVCVLMVSKAYRDLPRDAADRSVMPFLIHGYWLLIGVTLYEAFAFGLLKSVIGAFVCIIEWVVAGGASVALMRLVGRYVGPTAAKGEDAQ